MCLQKRQKRRRIRKKNFFCLSFFFFITSIYSLKLRMASFIIISWAYFSSPYFAHPRAKERSGHKARGRKRIKKEKTESNVVSYIFYQDSATRKIFSPENSIYYILYNIYMYKVEKFIPYLVYEENPRKCYLSCF